MHSKKHFLIYFTPWKRYYLLHSCFPEKHDFEVGILRWVRFWSKIIQRVRFWIKHFKRARIWKRVAFKNCRYNACCSEKSTFFALSLISRNARFSIKTLTMRQIRNTRIPKEPEFSLKKVKSVRIWTKAFTACQILKFKKPKPVRKWKKIHSKIHVWIMLPRETDVFAFLALLRNAWFWNGTSTMRHILK